MHIIIGLIGIAVFHWRFYLAQIEKYSLAICRFTTCHTTSICIYFYLKTKFGITVIGGISDGFNYLLAKAAEGVNFVFGGFEFVDPKNPLLS